MSKSTTPRWRALAFSAFLAWPAYASSQSAREQAALIAQQFVQYLDTADAQQANRLSSPLLRSKLPTPQLLATWQGLKQRYGKFSTCTIDSATSRPELVAVVLDCAFESSNVPVQLAVQAEAVAGIFLGMPRPRAAAPGGRERAMNFGQPGWLLPATLRLPDEGKPLATVVMVHGSGPQDRDGRVGQTTLFRDLAEQLAKDGIATFRYEKRTRQHALKLSAQADVTLDEEVIDDALSAVHTVKTLPDLAPGCTVLLGHSLGAYLAPYIVQANQPREVAALVLLAPPARPVAQVALEQIEYLLADQEQSTGSAVTLEAERRRLRNWLASNNTDAIATADLPRTFGPAAWRFFKGYDPLATWRHNKTPALALFGEKDYQVTQADWRGWQAVAGNEQGLQVEMIKGASHVFTPSTGQPSPRQYEVAARVMPAVAGKISSFVRQHCDAN